MRVVAEGVETEGQLHFLQQNACPEGPGLLSRAPATAKQITRLLQMDSTEGSRDSSRARLRPTPRRRHHERGRLKLKTLPRFRSRISPESCLRDG